MASVSVHEAKTHLSRLLRVIEEGGEVEITRRNRVVARIVPPKKGAKKKPLLGRMKGKFELGDAFFEPLPDEELRGWGLA